MSNITSIKATIETVKKLTDSVSEILADGKVNVRDITEIPSLVMEIKALVEAVKGVGAEAKDLDAAEMKEVLTSGLDLILYIAGKFGIGQ